MSPSTSRTLGFFTLALAITGRARAEHGCLPGVVSLGFAVLVGRPPAEDRAASSVRGVRTPVPVRIEAEKHRVRVALLLRLITC